MIKRAFVLISLLSMQQSKPMASQTSCKTQFESQESSQAAIETHSECTLTYKDKDETVGYVHYTLNHVAHTAIIEKVFIEKKFRGKKLGSQMFKTALEQILKLGYKDITVIADPFETDINSPNRPKARTDLVKFYEAFGFKVISSERQDPQDPSSPFVTSTMKYAAKK